MAELGNNRVANIVGTNGRATLNGGGRKLTEFCTFDHLQITNKIF